jgi:hypothetical protein
MRFDAHAINTDEAHHSRMSEDLKRQVLAATGVQVPGEVRRPRFLKRLDEIESKIPVDIRPTARLYFAVVSETLISSILCDIPADERVNLAVRHVIQDHREDEAKHHTYFSAVMNRTWQRLDARLQKIIGPLLPQFILAFLEPDYEAIVSSLREYDLAPGRVEIVMRESYPKSELLASIKKAASRTLALFASNQVFADSTNFAAFYEAGLLLYPDEFSTTPLLNSELDARLVPNA